MPHRPAKPLLASTARWFGLLAVMAAGLAGLLGSGGGGGSDPAPPAPSGPATISGIADFESVPNDTATNGGLRYGNTTLRPIRAATVQVLAAAGGAVLATGTTSASGAYSLDIAAAQPIFVRVRAEMLKTGGAGGQWNTTVRDNTQGNAVYALDSAVFTPASSTHTQNLRALSGWGGSSYTGVRAAAPFAILDTVYDTMQKVLSVSASAAFPELRLLWSSSNVPANGDPALGQIGTTFYQFTGGAHSIFVLGAANTDTDEYDRAIIAHEFGHYMQAVFSRDDSVGGPHSASDKLDMRVAFSEGWGSAWAGMALATPYITDSSGLGQQDGYSTDLTIAPTSNRGWYSEATVQYLLYQFHANPAIGFGPIFQVLSNFRTTLPADGAVSSLHAFAHRLKTAAPAQAGAIDALLASQQVTVTNALGAGETNSGGVADVLPIYKAHTAAPGGAQNHCVNDVPGLASAGFNQIGTYAYLRFTVPAGGQRTITVAGNAGSDPDFLVLRNDGNSTLFQESGGVLESATLSLNAGTHVIVLYDYALTHGNGAGLQSGVRCFDVTVQ